MTLKIEHFFPVAPPTIYNAWLSSDQHTAMTGASASISAGVGAPFSAWDGYISGTNKMLKKDAMIVQLWRTEDFLKSDPDSELIIQLDAKDHGSLLTLIHTGIPENQPDYEQGWWEYYLEPMESYFTKN